VLLTGFDPFQTWLRDQAAKCSFQTWMRSDPKRRRKKKSLSYANDCRNTYGENDKASRKAIPARKAGESRKIRRKANQALNVVDRLDDESAGVIESSLRQDIERVGGWKKSPDVPLADFMEDQARRRSWRGLTPNRGNADDPNVA